MVSMNYWLDRGYVDPNRAGITTGQTAGKVVSDPFAGLGAGEDRTVGNWTGRNIGGVTVVSNSAPNPGGMIDNYINRGYSLADATNAVVGTAAAGLDTTNARLRPAESKAGIGLTQAQTRLTGEQAKVVVPESTARISNLNADTGLTNTQSQIAKRDSLTPLPQVSDDDIRRAAALRLGVPVDRLPRIGDTSIYRLKSPGR